MQHIDGKLYQFIKGYFGLEGYDKPRQGFNIKNNVDNTFRDNKYYLKRYFPRSYKTSYLIFKDMYEYFISKGFKQEKNNIKILDIGSGTGGQLFGLLQVLNDFFSKTNINVYTVDGNSEALSASEIICEFKKECYLFNVEVNKKERKFSSKEDYVNYLKENFYDIDIIISFKFLNELYKQTDEKGFYSETMLVAEQILSDDGILCLADTTDPLTEGTKDFFPYISNFETHQFFEENQNSKLNFLMPFCCAKHISKGCSKANKCFTSFINGDDKINSKLFIKDGSFAEKIMENYFSKCSNLCNSTNGNNCHCVNRFVAMTVHDPLSRKDFYESSFSFRQFNV